VSRNPSGTKAGFPGKQDRVVAKNEETLAMLCNSEMVYYSK
jgi:hypothetical protein